MILKKFLLVGLVCAFLAPTNVFAATSQSILIIRPLWIFNPCPLVILNEFRGGFGDYFRFIFFFLIAKRYNLVVPKDFPAKSNFHIQISFSQVSTSTLIPNGYNISNQATNITTIKYFFFINATLNIGQQFTNKDYLINIHLLPLIKKLPP